MAVEAAAARTNPWPLLAAAGLWLLILLLAVTQVVLTVAVTWNAVPAALRPTSSTLAGAITTEIAAAVGVLIAIRRPDNLIGWLLLSISLTAATIALPGPYAGYSVYIHPLPGALWIYWVSQITWLLIFGQLLVLLPLVFPDGRLLSRRWLVPIGLYGGFLLIGFLVALDPAATAPLPNPAGVRAFAGMSNLFNSAPFIVLFLAICSTGPISLIVRYRRGSELERQQLKWLMLALVVLLLALASQILVPPVSGSPILPLAAAAVPVAIGLAVLRYRLYDIDVILNRALVYGGLAVVITLAYLLVVVGIGALVGQSQELLLSLITTAVIALAFQPLRQRAQRLANRLVYGKRASPYETLSQFSDHLSETFTQEDILDRMSRLLAQGTGAERAEVWVRTGGRLLLASSSPAVEGSTRSELAINDGTLPAMDRDRVAPVTYQGELLGALAVAKKRGESMNPVEQQLVSNLAAQAGLVLKNAGLNRELLARLDDLRASRQRLVAAQDDERRRIERDLHDGAQQHLVALKVKLGLAETAAEPQSKVRGMLTQLKADADEALMTMRELARGIYPPLLASDGLPAALRAQARRVIVPIELDFGDVPRLARELEGAIYFCCLEAMQNVSKYAEASSIRLRLWAENSTVSFEVADDGKGFDLARTHAVSGIENMRDRLEGVGGTFAIRSVPGHGTTVSGSVPVAAPVSS